MPARHFLRLAQGAFAGAHVVVEHLPGRGHRRVGEAKPLGVVFVALGHAERIGLFGERDRVLLAIGEAADDDAGQAVLALQAHEVVFQAGEIENEAALFVRTRSRQFSRPGASSGASTSL